ncbi:2-C-methyl-D-erythritol 4-phosphate cytidylyltransferase [Humisphaera borealis]|uniref:2-C-methyl-D-erythritol 4-phosphate cytidylyltransferase n=1 Tax=Humisphaera borealis TaxID=2807512 RepID=A0A7M2WXV2_9BACT|nr:2-C-methyl-D-erythritol 4-phosphate cytidylyltransferase [Humisphaera borealis]QOV90315.1 2-C-methyl-D-erythritol 4-phosphate cytidylyltransferase [Humisphaera borealis]
MTLPQFTLVLPAAGTSSRFGSNKLLASLGGETVFNRTLNAFLAHPALAGVVVATQDPNALRQASIRTLDKFEARGIPVQFVAGGDCRAQSVANAVTAAAADIEWIAVHDAARPLVSAELINRTLLAAVEHGAAAPAMAVTSTVKQTAGPLPAQVLRTISRETLWALQTPQIARRSALLDSIGRCPVPLSSVTDDLQLIELNGGDTWLVVGDERNIKLTTSSDLAIAESLLARVPTA